jgi:hypothetical protein
MFYVNLLNRGGFSSRSDAHGIAAVGLKSWMNLGKGEWGSCMIEMLSISGIPVRLLGSIQNI